METEKIPMRTVKLTVDLEVTIMSDSWVPQSELDAAPHDQVVRAVEKGLKLSSIGEYIPGSEEQWYLHDWAVI